MFVLGFGLAFLNANAAKILGAWFPQQMVGDGIYIAGAGRDYDRSGNISHVSVCPKCFYHFSDLML
jgi:hypothetical protein